MHLVISYATLPPDVAAAQMSAKFLPRLAQLVRQCDISLTLEGQASDLSPLHERIACAALWPDATFPDGLIPWAAWRAAQMDPTIHPTIDHTPQHAYAFISPCHVRPQADHVSMNEPAELALDEAESRDFMAAMQPYFAEDGIALTWLQNDTWLARGAVFQDLPCASIDRVRGARIDEWMPRNQAAAALRRLQNEMQMLLYTHPLNDAREARHALTVNSFWISGTGSLPSGDHKPHRAPPMDGLLTNRCMHTLDTLRQPALQGNASAWLAQWRHIEAQELAAWDTVPTRLSLCGERRAITLVPSPQRNHAWRRLRMQLAPPSLFSLLQPL